MHLIFRVHELRYLWLNSVFVVTFTVTTFMGGVVTFMGVCDTYGKLLDTYGSFVIFMGVVTFMGRTKVNKNNVGGSNPVSTLWVLFSEKWLTRNS